MDARECLPEGPCRPPAVNQAMQHSGLRGYQVRLSNVPPELTARDLAEAFGRVSQSRVESVDLLRNSEGKATGESLVIFSNMQDAKNAVQRYHGGDLNGRRLLAIYEGEIYSRR